MKKTTPKELTVIIVPTDTPTDIVLHKGRIGYLHLQKYYGRALMDMGDKYAFVYLVDLNQEEKRGGDWILRKEIGSGVYSPEQIDDGHINECRDALKLHASNDPNIEELPSISENDIWYIVKKYNKDGLFIVKVETVSQFFKFNEQRYGTMAGDEEGIFKDIIKIDEGDNTLKIIQEEEITPLTDRLYSYEDMEKAFKFFMYKPFPHNVGHPTFEEWMNSKYKSKDKVA